MWNQLSILSSIYVVGGCLPYETPVIITTVLFCIIWSIYKCRKWFVYPTLVVTQSYKILFINHCYPLLLTTIRWETDQSPMGPGWQGWSFLFCIFNGIIALSNIPIIAIKIVTIIILQGVLTFQEKKFLLAVERGDVASTRWFPNNFIHRWSPL